MECWRDTKGYNRVKKALPRANTKGGLGSFYNGSTDAIIIAIITKHRPDSIVVVAFRKKHTVVRRQSDASTEQIAILMFFTFFIYTTFLSAFISRIKLSVKVVKDD